MVGGGGGGGSSGETKIAEGIRDAKNRCCALTLHLLEKVGGGGGLQPPRHRRPCIIRAILPGSHYSLFYTLSIKTDYRLDCALFKFLCKFENSS